LSNDFKRLLFLANVDGDNNECRVRHSTCEFSAYN
jgi:hypothetical protein